ncbi:hypothetical protein ACFQZC_34550 [Streptacidiphilus monticola]
MAAEMTQLREAGVEFGVNLFAPHPVPIDEAEYLRYAEELALRPPRWASPSTRRCVRTTTTGRRRSSCCWSIRCPWSG